MEYLDFSVTILPQREGQFPVRVDAPAGNGHDVFRLPFGEEERAQLIPSLSQSVARGTTRSTRGDAPPPETVTPPEVIGGRLFQALFHGEVRVLFERSLGMIHDRGDTGLRIKLRIDPDEAPELGSIAGLPWEYLYRKDTRDFLSLSMRTPVVRYLEVPRPPEPLRLEKPLRILFVLASPKDQPALDLEREKALVEQALSGQQQAGEVEFRFLEHATAHGLLRELDEAAYHVIHFMGHGDFDPDSGEGRLCLEDPAGHTDVLSARKLMTLLQDRKSVRLVFLNACQTATFAEGGGRFDAFMGVAPALVMGGVTAVIAMQFPISDEAAMAFAEELYTQLAKSWPVDEAVSKARQAVQVRTDGQEWGTPVLFMRTRDGRIFDAAPVPAAPALAGEEGPPAEVAAPPRPAELRLGPVSLPRKVALGIGAAAIVLAAALVAAMLLLQPQPTAYVGLVLDNGPVGGQQGWSEVRQVLVEELDRSLPSAALALRVFDEGCNDTDLLVDYARGNLDRVVEALADVRLVNAANLVEAVRQELDNVLGQRGDQPRAVVVVTWGEDTCGGDLKRALEAYRDQLGSAVSLYLLNVGTSPGPELPGPDGVHVTNAEQARTVLRVVLDAMGQGQWPVVPAPWTPTPTSTAPVTRRPTATPTAVTPTSTRTPTLTASVTPTPTLPPPASLDQPWNIAWQGLDARVKVAMGQILATGEKLRCTRQEFEHGFMFWCDRQSGKHRTGEGPNMVYAVEYAGRHRAWYLVDTWTEEEGEVACPLTLPAAWPPLVGGFRKAWCEQRAIRDALEAPLEAEHLLTKVPHRDYGYGPGVIEFEGGHMLWDTGTDKLWVLPGGFAWQSFELGDYTATPRPTTTPMPTATPTPTVTPTATFTPSPTPTPTPEPVARNKIAFTSRRSGVAQIYLMDPDGSGVQQLTLEGENEAAAWSPDGKWLAFTSTRDGDAEIYVMRADGSDARNLTQSPGSDDEDATWSPDGQRLAFTSDRSGHEDIYVIGVDGSGLRRLTTDPAQDSAADWSVQGQIAFVSDRDDSYNDRDDPEIYVMDDDGSNQQNVSRDVAADYFPRWSPDGSQIVFKSHVASSMDLFVMDADGSGKTRLTDEFTYVYAADWSPDGRTLVFALDTDCPTGQRSNCNREIYMVAATGGALTRLSFEPAADWGPVWSPE